MDTKSLDDTTTEARNRVVSEIFTVPVDSVGTEVSDSADIFDEDAIVQDGLPVPGYPALRYMPYGPTDEMPYDILRSVGSDEVLSQNLLFNILTAYGSGLQYTDKETGKPTEDSEICSFLMRNSMKSFFLEQCTDMKHFFFAVAVIILNRDGDKIVQVRHKDACYCRFEKANRKGLIDHVFFANWRRVSALTKKDIECVELLDERDPLGHLEIKMGRAYGSDGEKRIRTSARKFAIVMRFPTPGKKYYPSPYYLSIFRGDWYDIKRLIGKGKKAKIRNHAAVRHQVEIHADYWNNLLDQEGIIDPVKQKERIDKEKQNIRDFVTGIENSGKVWITGYYVDPYGKEQHMVKISVIDSGKEGGDWSEDTQEASNMLCYGTNIHPNLVGATPGKSQSNNSGSDKRELFTLKQSLETSFRDMLLRVHELIIWYNGWKDKVVPSVPIVLLTTLDQKTDAKQIDPNSNAK